METSMPKNLFPIPSPIKGINRVMSREQQPDGTCWNALNIVPYDKYGRARVSQRTGLSKLYSMQLGSGGPIQGMIAPPNILYPGQTYYVPQTGLTGLTGWPGSTFTFPGPFGPYNNPTTRGSWTSPGFWNWTFTLTTLGTHIAFPDTNGTAEIIGYCPVGSSSGVGNTGNLI